MIKEKYLKIKGHPRNIKHYTNLGYQISVGEEIDIQTIHLMKGSSYKITTICDKCLKETTNCFKDYFIYTNGLSTTFYCQLCSFDKQEQTNIKKYGFGNAMKSEIVKNNLKNSLIEKYGVDHYSKTDEYKIKFKKTSVERYGVEYPAQNEDIKNKNKKTSLENYGVTHHMKLSSFKRAAKNGREKHTLNRYREEFKLPEEYKIISYKDGMFDISHSDHEFMISTSLLNSRYIHNKVEICTICNLIGVQHSYMETEISNFIQSLGIGVIENKREIGIELDINIPSHNLAIEANGVYWHSEIYKKKDYHLNKTELCRENGIQLLHIWEDDWKYKREILKSIILNKLNLIKNKIYARKCYIKEVDSKLARQFLDQNHIQGFSTSSIKLGLYYNDELVSLMTFGLRNTNSKYQFELIRFCNKININVIGAASKIFKYFINNFNFKEIISYCDMSIFDGSVYKKLGFELISVSDPNYFWVVDGVRKHRFNYNKKKLIKMGHDPLKTEVEIMHELDYYRVWGCGHQKYVYMTKI